MKKVKSIHAGLIAAVLLASVSTSAMGGTKWYERTNAEQAAHLAHWYPYSNGLEYFFMCTIGQQCEGSKWR